MRNLTIAVLTLTMLAFASCNTQPKFKVEGHVANSDGEMLYLEVRDIHKNTLIDSCKLDKNGNFVFKQPKPEYPQFYALKLKNQPIFFSIDSTETIKINTQIEHFSTQYEVEGSENAQKIKELCLLQYDTQKKVTDLLSKKMPPDSLAKSLDPVLKVYKEKAISYIVTGDIASSRSPVAYFAIFQRINDLLIFDVFDPNDNKIFAAVATGYEMAYPSSPRTKHLKNLTLQGRNAIKSAKKNPVELNVSYSGNIEIELPNLHGEIIKLSSTSGKVVLLDFTIYQSDFSPERNLDLRELYSDYTDKGLEIYQVSLDADNHFWMISASNLPWICVRDEAGMYSSVARMYNIQELPTYYLLNREGELSKKGHEIDDDLKRAIQQML